MSDMRDDLARLTKIWDKAQAQNIFGKSDAQAASERDNKQVNFFGQMPNVFDTEINQDDMGQWNDVMRTMNDHFDPRNQRVLNEEKNPSKKKIKDNVKKSANAQNPVYPDSIGKDTELKPVNNFSSGKGLDSLDKLKKQLHDLQDKMLGDEVFGKNVSKIEKSIENITNEIDKLSDMLNGNKLSDGKKFKKND